jgi:hypothetical protein
MNNYEMSEFQVKALRHLLSGGSERLGALADLKVTGAFDCMTVDAKYRAKKHVEDYLRRNPRGFCNAGIERFREAVGLTPPEPETYTYNVTLTLTVKPKGHWGGGHFGRTGEFARSIEQAVKDHAKQGEMVEAVVDATVTDIVCKETNR